MGGGNVRSAAVCAAVLAAAAIAGGCGAETHKNESRPQTPTRVSVSISDDSISVRPERIAFGPEPTQQIPQNQHTTQPQVRSKAPLTVVIVAANLTDTESKLELRGPRDASSEKLVPNANGLLQADLPTGVYTVTAADIPGAKPGKLIVGPYRTSSENDVLLP